MPGSLDFADSFMPVVRAILDAVPTLTITSGRRTIIAQLQAMVENEIERPGYIKATYYPTPLVNWLVKEVKKDLKMNTTYRHPQTLAARLALSYSYDIGAQFSYADIQRLSRHLVGEAIDLEPGTPAQEEAIRKVLSEIPYKTKFLMKEHGLPRWHIQLVD